MPVPRSCRALCLGLFLTVVLGSQAIRAEEVPGGPDPQGLNQRLGRGVNIIGYDPLWSLAR